ncbi:hypothetical protein HPTD01_2803 [Halomonas sp. TD01]|uniref:hypothetical protein n=1 Tax=Halomonas sp. GT TaxID=1971364 RepID=UPI0012EC1928|nr:hypothetical protein [Halomonas sp. GT]CAH1044325.1 hypothetical protein HPTD01_2803 [Halomonas sp. TD01]
MSSGSAGAPMPKASPMHQFRIQVLDGAGQVFYGVTINLYARDAYLGGIEESDGEATIRYPASLGPVTVLIEADGYEAQTTIGADRSSHTFSLPTSRQRVTGGKREARCADGTSGQPCVVCAVGNSTVRICA